MNKLIEVFPIVHHLSMSVHVFALWLDMQTAHKPMHNRSKLTWCTRSPDDMVHLFKSFDLYNGPSHLTLSSSLCWMGKE